MPSALRRVLLAWDRSRLALSSIPGSVALILTLLAAGCGDDTTRPTEPVQTAAPDSTALTAGLVHTCGTSVSGTTYCWGSDEFGQLGNERDTTEAGAPPAPLHMPASITFTTVKAGEYHTCALTDAGAAYCWGADDYGQIGNDQTTTSPVVIPVTVRMPDGVSFVRLAAGYSHTCGLTESGEAYCWGNNKFGELGDGSTSNREVPVAMQMPDGVEFTTMSAGQYHTCALTPAGSAYCWGHNGLGQLGDGSTKNSALPVQVHMPSGVTFTALAAGTLHTCALTDAGAAYCWGTNNNGQLGDGSTNQSEVPIAVSLPDGVTLSSLSAGAYHTCGLTDAGAAYCWGLDEVGQLGDGHEYDGSIETSAVPVAVVMPPGVSFTTMVSGYGHNCALTPAGKAYCWGHDYLGAVDDGSVDDSPVPVPVVSGLTFQVVGSER